MRAAGLLLLLVLPARGQEWITRWADDADCVVDEDSEPRAAGCANSTCLCGRRRRRDDAAANTKTGRHLGMFASTIVVDASRDDCRRQEEHRGRRGLHVRKGKITGDAKLPHDDDPQSCALRDGVYRDEGRRRSRRPLTGAFE